MRPATKFVAMFLAVLFFSSTAFGAQFLNLQNDNGGFGPKIKGIQLGAKMSLHDLVMYLVNLGKLPFVIDINNSRNFKDTINSIGSLTLEFNGSNNVITDFSIKQATRNFTKLYEMDLPLENLLAEIEATGVMYTDMYLGRTLKSFPDEIIKFDDERRVISFRLRKTDFVPKSTDAGSFLRDFTKAYKIPFSGRIRGNIWTYQEAKWKMTFFHASVDDIILFERIEDSVFN